MADVENADRYAVITIGATRRVLRPGETLTFGRDPRNDVPIGSLPADLRIPRTAGRLECRADLVLVHNLSDKRSLQMEPVPGPSYEVSPLMVVGTHPHVMVTVVLRGDAGVRYAMTVDARRLVSTAPRRSVEPAISSQDRTVGYLRIESLTMRQRELLMALCLPETHGWRGQRGTPTYAEMQTILRERGAAISAKTVRNMLDDLRRHLAVDHGVDGIYEEEPAGPRGGRQSFLPELARWARLSGNVTEEELVDFADRTAALD